MANKVEIIVVAKDETKPTFDGVKDKAKKAGDDAGKSLGDGIAKGMADTKSLIEKNGIAPISQLIATQQRAAKAAENLGKAQVKFGEDSKEAADASLTLVRANIALESSSQNAAAAVGKMSPELEKMLKNVGSSSKQIDGIGKSLENGFKKLATDATKEGAEFGENFGKSLAESSSKEVGKLGPILAPVVAVAATFLGGVLVAGITAVLAGGALAGGIALAVKDPKIMQAFGDLGTQIMTSLNQAAEVFKKPLLDTLPVFRTAWQGIEKDITSIFQKAATWVAPLAEATSSFVKSFSSGLNDLVGNADPVIQALFDGIKQVGEAFGDFFTEMSEHGPEAAGALSDAFGVLSLAIEGTGKVLGFLADSWDWLKGAVEQGVWGKITNDFLGYNDVAEDTTTVTEGVGRAFDGAKSSIEQTRDEMKRMSDDLRAATDPMFALIKAQDAAKETQDKYNEAVKKHGVNSEEARRASLNLAIAAVDLATKSGEAAGTFDGKLTPAMRNALTAAGATKQEIDAVEKSVSAAHSALTKYEGTYTAHVVTIFEQTGKPSSLTSQASNTYKGQRSGGISGAAMSGGVHGNLTLVGEDGPEIVSLPYGSSVKTAGATNQLLEEAVDPRKQKPGAGNSDWMANESILFELKSLNRALAQRGNVYLDNRLVGAYGGEQADIYARVS